MYVPNSRDQCECDREIDARHGHQPTDVLAAARRTSTRPVGQVQFVAEQIEQPEVRLKSLALLLW